MRFEVIVRAYYEDPSLPNPYWSYEHAETFIAAPEAEDEEQNHRDLADAILTRVDEAGMSIAKQAGQNQQYRTWEERGDERRRRKRR